MKQLPAHVNAYKRTPEFNEQTVPVGLLKAHQTKTDVWGKIVVLEGQLQYIINEPESELLILDQCQFGVVNQPCYMKLNLWGQFGFMSNSTV